MPRSRDKWPTGLSPAAKGIRIRYYGMPDETGRRPPVSRVLVGVTDRAEAKIIRDARIRDAVVATGEGRHIRTVRDAIVLWKARRWGDFAPATQKTYATLLGRIERAIGDCRLIDL